MGQARQYRFSIGFYRRVLTTEQGVQIYRADLPSGAIEGPHGYPYPKHAGLCLETQHYPDSPNHPQFPSTVPRRGDATQRVVRGWPGVAAERRPPVASGEGPAPRNGVPETDAPA